MQNSTGWLARNAQIRRALTCGLLLVLLGLTVDPPFAFAQSAPPALRGEFTIGKSGRFILLPVTLADRTVDCLLDTGASLSAFDITLRPLLGKPQPSRMVDSPAGSTRIEAFEWPNVKLGEQIIRSQKPVACIDLKSVRQAVDADVYGVIGMDVLAASRMQIDFDRGVLTFLERLPQPRAIGRPNPSSVCPWRDAVRFGVDWFGGRESFLIDTGTQGNSLANDFFDVLVDGGRIRLGSTFASVTIAGETRGERGRLDRLTVGQFTHDDLRFSRVKMSSLGLRYLSRFRPVFDFPDSCLYLKPRAHFEKSEPQATSGLMLKWIDGEIRVDGVREDGPAEVVGIKAGDVVLQVDGKPAPQFDPFSLRELLTSTGGKKVALIVRRNERRFNFQLVLAAD